LDVAVVDEDLTFYSELIRIKFNLEQPSKDAARQIIIGEYTSSAQSKQSTGRK